MSRCSFVLLLALLAVAQATSLRGGAIRSLTEKEKEKDEESERVPCSKPVVYEVVNECKWSSKSHPVDYPSDAHWSPLCGTTHTDEVALFSLNGTSTDGVKLVAETGSCDILEGEIEACADEDKCASFFKYPCDPFSGTCTHMGTVNVTMGYPYISLLSMIAPSPDWIVGVDSFGLCKDDYWVPEYEKYLMALDAGTDAGVTFASKNDEIEDRLPIIAFDAEDESNIFYNPEEGVLNPLCKIKITLAA